MKIKSVESTFPTRVGMTISGCKGNFYSGNGSRYAMVVGTNESSHNVDKIVATTNPYVNSEYLRLYPGMESINTNCLQNCLILLLIHYLTHIVPKLFTDLRQPQD